MCVQLALAYAMARNRGWGKLMAQAYEALFNHVVAEGSADQESYKVDRRFAQEGKARGAPDEIDAEEKLLP
jgi:hypothetical protein